MRMVEIVVGRTIVEIIEDCEQENPQNKNLCRYVHGEMTEDEQREFIDLLRTSWGMK